MRFFLNHLLFVLIGIVGTSFSYGQNFYENGCKEALNGNFAKSVEQFTLAIENNQEVAKAYMMRGAAKGLLNQFYPAIQDLNSSRNLDSTNFKLYYYYGKVYIIGGFYSTALKYFNIADSINPNDARVFDNRAIAKTYLGEFTSAIEDEDVAIKIDSSEQEFYTNRGFAKSQLKKYDLAIADYNISLKIKPSHKAYANRGYAYSEIREYLKAIEDYTMGIKMSPEDKILYFRRGLSYKSLGKTDLACLDIEKSAKLGYPEAIQEAQKRCLNLLHPPQK